METNTPLVSIIVPVSNAGRFLAGSIQSLLSQSYRNIEIIVVDDNSCDDSFVLLKQLRKQDKRLRLYRNIKKYGLSTCFNRAFKRAKGDFIAFMDPKDVTSKKRIKEQLITLLAKPKVVAVGSQCTFIDEKNKKVGKSAFPCEYKAIYQQLISGSSLLFESIMINKKLLPKDLLHFKASYRPPLYEDLLVKLQQYGELMNLNAFLYTKRQSSRKFYEQIRLLPMYLKLWLTSITLYEYRPSLRSLFTPLVKQL